MKVAMDRKPFFPFPPADASNGAPQALSNFLPGVEPVCRRPLRVDRAVLSSGRLPIGRTNGGTAILTGLWLVNNRRPAPNI
jgi:hypothetical protein